jgi:hypothetical protein
MTQPTRDRSDPLERGPIPSCVSRAAEPVAIPPWQLIQRLPRHREGLRSGRLDLEQLHLILLEDAEQSAAKADAAKEAAEPAERRRHKTAANRNRGALPAHLPRYEVLTAAASIPWPAHHLHTKPGGTRSSISGR